MTKNKREIKKTISATEMNNIGNYQKMYVMLLIYHRQRVLILISLWNWPSSTKKSMCTQSYFIQKHRLLFRNLKISKDACSKSQQKRKPKSLNRCLKQDQGKGSNLRSQIRIYLCVVSHRNWEMKVQAEAFLVK